MRNESISLNARNLAIFGILAVCLYLIQDFVAPLLLGGIFAIVVYPLFSALKKIGAGPALSAAITTGLFAVLFLGPMVGLVVSGAKAANQYLAPLVQSDAASPFAHLEEQVEATLETVSHWTSMPRAELSEMIKGGATSLAKTLVELARDFVSGLPSVFISALVILVSLFCFLTQGQAIVRLLEELSVFTPENTKKVFKSVEQSSRSALLSSSVTGIVQAAIMCIGALLLGFEAIALIGIATLFFSFVPFIGTAPIPLLLAASLFLQGSGRGAILALILGLVAGTVDNILRPYLVQEGNDIHPLSAFVFTFGALNVIGIYGLFLGPVAAGVVLAMVDLMRNTRAHEPVLASHP